MIFEHESFHLQVVFVDLLYTTPVDESMEILPSPEKLKYKIIVKARKASGADVHVKYDDEDDSVNSNGTVLSDPDVSCLPGSKNDEIDGAAPLPVGINGSTEPDHPNKEPTKLERQKAEKDSSNSIPLAPKPSEEGSTDVSTGTAITSIDLSCDRLVEKDQHNGVSYPSAGNLALGLCDHAQEEVFDSKKNSTSALEDDDPNTKSVTVPAKPATHPEESDIQKDASSISIRDLSNETLFDGRSVKPISEGSRCSRKISSSSQSTSSSLSDVRGKSSKKKSSSSTIYISEQSDYVVCV